jgi:hypothetical protein
MLVLKNTFQLGDIEQNILRHFAFFFLPDLIEKALRKLAGRALRNEIDVTEVWFFSLFVSPPKAQVYSPVVTYFILACSANF